MLLLSSWTVLFAQTGKDSIACYTQSELVKIADVFIHGQECDSLYSICEKQLEFQTNSNFAYKMALSAKNKELSAVESVVVLKENLIAGKDTEITGLRDINKKVNRKLKWTRIGWISTSALFTYFILTK